MIVDLMSALFFVFYLFIPTYRSKNFSSATVTSSPPKADFMF